MCNINGEKRECSNNDKSQFRDRADAYEKFMIALFNGDEEEIINIYDSLLEEGYVSEKNLSEMFDTPNNNDVIFHPDHYTDGPIECFDLICSMEGRERAKGFAIGNCWKYLYRHGKKGDDAEDIRKMMKYAEFYIKLIEEDKDVNNG